MKLHEFQAKNIFRDSGIPTPNGQLVTSSNQVRKVIQVLDGPPWVVKAQIHAGARGKAGGVIVAHSVYEVVAATEQLLGRPLVTAQTGSAGVIVHEVLIEEGIEIDHEFYLSIVIDRSHSRPAMIFGQAGGVEIEDVAGKTPDLIWKEHIDPVAGWKPYQARNLIYQLDPLPSSGAIRTLTSIMATLYKIFTTLDCSLVEINPLVTTEDGKVVALDGKISIDYNSLYRHKELLELDDPRGKDPIELMAEKYQLNYVGLDGDVGAMVNGAGLAMATMDLIKTAGAEPANFLDVGGGANEEMIAKSFEIILQNRRVKTVLINIFGGILRCDALARGVLAAAEKTMSRVPLIVRLEGTNAEEGRNILKNSSLKFLVAKDLAETKELLEKQIS